MMKMASALILAAVAYLVVRAASPAAARVAGAVILVTAAALLVWTRVRLGSAFTVKAKPKGLVTTGPYSRIRHPMYVFLDVALLGLILVAGNEYLLLVWVLLAALHVWRARREETLLEEAFGEAYKEYRDRTWF